MRNKHFVVGPLNSGSINSGYGYIALSLTGMYNVVLFRDAVEEIF